MAGLSLDAFEAEVATACTASVIVTGISIVGSGITWTHLRAHLGDGSFADAFYNETTGKKAFALIRDGHRVFGADNTGGWHWHPFESPDEHRPSAEAVTFDRFISLIQERING